MKNFNNKIFTNYSNNCYSNGSTTTYTTLEYLCKHMELCSISSSCFTIDNIDYITGIGNCSCEP